jgi:hypothetical protein
MYTVVRFEYEAWECVVSLLLIYAGVGCSVLSYMKNARPISGTTSASALGVHRNYE